MKKFILTVLLCLLMAGCAYPVTPLKTGIPIPAPGAESGTIEWSSPEFNMSIKYPHTWLCSENTSAIVQFASPLADATPEYREYIVIGFMPNTDGLSDVEIADATPLDMKDFAPEIQVTETGTEEVAGVKMQKRVFGGRVNNENIGPEGDYIWYQYSWLMDDGYSYSITFAGTQDTLSQYLPVLQYMLKTFKYLS